jgi:3-hydroxy-9,10-secoandrosta-1,3,5(10)-triene-9,17-dione monooxygenase
MRPPFTVRERGKRIRVGPVSVAAPPAEGLVERVRALVPMLRENARKTEEARRVLPEHFEALAEAGVFRMAAPKRFGGYEADFETQCDVLAEIARGCPSTSWVSTIFSAMAWLGGVFPDEAQEEMFASGDPRFSGALTPFATLEPADGGFVLNGRWPVNTGCHGANWTYLHAVRQDGGEGVLTGLFVQSSELAILDDWYASGMAGTGSNTVVAEGVFVPSHRTLPAADLTEGRYPERHNSSNPYFAYPLAAVLAGNAAGMPVGTARGALEAFLERLPGRAMTYTTYPSQAAAPVTHAKVGEAALKIESADAHMRRMCGLLDRRPGPLTLEERVGIRAHCGYATGLAREAVDTLFSASGASSIQSSVPIQRYQRDIQALSNHAVMSPAINIELYGRWLCGVEPNTPIV